jgi:hypothetical protein
MAQRIGTPGQPSHYAQSARFAARFSNALKKPVPPSLVADKILELATTGTWQLRHLVGPDSGPLVNWRNGMADEEWIDVNAADDATFFARLASM